LLARPLLATILLSAIATAQQSSSDATTLKVTSRIVILDVDVVNKKTHSLVNNLTEDDFTILEDKIPQTIRSFDRPSSHAMPRPGEAVVHSAADLPKIGNAPVTILVLDELNTHFEDMSFSRQSLLKYLAAQPRVLLQPTALLIATNTRFTQVQDYTQDRDQLIEEVKHHAAEVPWKLSSGLAGAGSVERMAQTLASIEQIAQASAGTPGRKNIIWIGLGFPSSDMTALDAHTAGTIQAAVRQCTNMLLASRSTVYIIDPVANDTTTVLVESPADLAMVEDRLGTDPFVTGITFFNLAPQTGGRIFASRNDLNNEIAQSIAASTNYYTLAYVPTGASTNDAKYRHIRIKLRNSDLVATTRDGYYPQALANAPSPTATEPRKQALAQIQLDLSSAVTSSMSYNGLTITAAKADQGTYSVTVADTNKSLTWQSISGAREKTEVTILAAWYDSKRKLLGHVAHELTAIRANSSGAATFSMPVTLPGGVSRVRLVVRDAASGRIGTVDLTTF
jgi:VWFA-related protein